MPTISDETIGKLVTPVGATATAFKTLLCDGNGGPVLVLGYDGSDYHILKCNASRQLEVVMSGKATDSDKLDGLDSTAFLQLTGGTMTGKITLDGAPTADLHASTKKYVDDSATAGAITEAVRSAFCANLSGDFTPSAGVATKMPFDTEGFDDGGHYDHATNYRWTPPAGCVNVSIGVYWLEVENTTQYYIAVYKNGAVLKVFSHSSITATLLGQSLSVWDQANGTDYYEAIGYRDKANGYVEGDTAHASWFSGACLYN